MSQTYQKAESDCTRNCGIIIRMRFDALFYMSANKKLPEPPSFQFAEKGPVSDQVESSSFQQIGYKPSYPGCLFLPLDCVLRALPLIL